MGSCPPSAIRDTRTDVNAIDCAIALADACLDHRHYRISKLDACYQICYTLCIMHRFNFIDLFAGIGGIRIPFEKLGGTCVFSSEWDKHAQQTYAHNFGEIPAGDITKIDEADIPDHVVPNIIGNRVLKTHAARFFGIRISAFLLENVKQLLDQGKTFAVILSRLGYTTYHKVLNALDFGLPQNGKGFLSSGF